jgi:hypothetical protein
MEIHTKYLLEYRHERNWIPNQKGKFRYNMSFFFQQLLVTDLEIQEEHDPLKIVDLYCKYFHHSDIYIRRKDIIIMLIIKVDTHSEKRGCTTVLDFVVAS